MTYDEKTEGLRVTLRDKYPTAIATLDCSTCDDPWWQENAESNLWAWAIYVNGNRIGDGIVKDDMRQDFWPYEYRAWLKALETLEIPVPPEFELDLTNRSK